MSFQKFTGGDTRTSTAEGGDPLLHSPQHGLWSGAGRKRPGVGTQTLVLLNFSAVVPTLLKLTSHRYRVVGYGSRCSSILFAQFCQYFVFYIILIA